MYRWFRFLESLRGSQMLLPLKRVLIDQVGHFESHRIQKASCIVME